MWVQASHTGARVWDITYMYGQNTRVGQNIPTVLSISAKKEMHSRDYMTRVRSHIASLEHLTEVRRLLHSGS